MQLRIGRACQMLVRTDEPMSRIAVECGFSDAADLARQFRAARGVAPSEFGSIFNVRGRGLQA